MSLFEADIFSIKQWNREAWTSDRWGRNFLGTQPHGRADYAFFQHILKSMSPSPAGIKVQKSGASVAQYARNDMPIQYVLKYIVEYIERNLRCKKLSV